ncbi:restriction endonuclease subunit S domain-containing protein [Streptomyces akebiae]|uniref:Type I restriction modification DNA specificity domain-containing protein n=1 Tax=Streptomyces akebiae TaxID=2865673 RepID=A0ABX8XL64_9ACTN|nr:hypothetical protein [Streptomyces akebiae]QYX76294.1 hypothetical protein K1J60_07040 [Streptomyces akebiae]
MERAKWLLSRRRRGIRPEDGIVTAFRDGQVTLRENRRTEGFTNAIQEIGYQGIRKGDLVVHGMDGFAGAIGVADSDGKASPVVHAYTPNGNVDARYMAYTLRTMALSGYITTLAKGIRERSTAFDAPTLANVQLPVPPLREQRRIADFLDAETARIDEVSQRFRRLSDLAQERVRAIIDSAFAECGNESRVPVSAVCRAIVDCVNKTAPVSAETTPYKMIRTSNIRNGEVDLTNTFSVEKEVFTEWNRRGTPRSGDILFTREAPLGQVGMLRSDEKVFLGQRIMLYRANESRIRKELLLFNFLGSHMNRQLRTLGAGSLHEHMRVGDGLKLLVFCPPLGQQDALVMQIQEGRDASLRLFDLAQKQLALLSERRQALIVAAVTGQFDVTTASGRNVTEGVTV